MFEESIAIERKLLEGQVEKILAESDRGAQSNKDKVAWSGWRKFKISKIVEENQSITSFYFIPHDGKSLASFLPGQHLTFRLKVPGLSKPVIRCYSLSDSADKAYYRISVKKQSSPAAKLDVPNGVASTYLHEVLEVGDVVDVKAPSGKFYLDQTEKTPIVMIGGGIGVTPSLSMLNALAAEKSQRKMYFFYAVQRAEELIMSEQIKTLSYQLPNLMVVRFYSEADGVTVSEFERLGYVDIATMHALSIPWDSDFYVCGPPPMMQAVVGGLEREGVDTGRIHFESFGPASVSKRSVEYKAQADTNTESHLITFTMSDTQVEWSQAKGSILDVAESAGVNMESGCRAGSCGSCLTAIAEGKVSYIDEPGVEIEKGSCLACIAVPAGDLKLNA